MFSIHYEMLINIANLEIDNSIKFACCKPFSETGQHGSDREREKIECLNLIPSGAHLQANFITFPGHHQRVCPS